MYLVISEDTLVRSLHSFGNALRSENVEENEIYVCCIEMEFMNYLSSILSKIGK
jgi:hypothetical protein